VKREGRKRRKATERAPLPPEASDLDGPARDSTKPTSADAPLAQGGCEEALTTRSRRRALPLGAQSEPTATWRQLPPARLVRAGDTPGWTRKR